MRSDTYSFASSLRDRSDRYPVSKRHDQDDDNAHNDDYPVTQQDEDWLTKKKVETVITKNLERQLQRQVVLDDGRVIAEDAPEVTNDLVEDRQTHEDDGAEARQLGFDDGLAGWSSERGDTVLGERFRRNVNTNDVRTRSTTSAAANNLGELSHKDVDEVVQKGRDVRSLVRSYDVDRNTALTIPAKVIDHSKSHKRHVDKEDVHEVDRMHEGRLKTDRYVTREVIEDDGDEARDDRSSDESESHDGDAHAYSNRKEERFVDYYKVPYGKPASKGQYLRRGVHMTTEDKDSRRVDPWSKRSRNTALMYDHNSDSTDNYVEKPPRPERNRKASRDRKRLPSSERSFPGRSTAYSAPSANRFHTIERSEKVGRSKVNNDYRPKYGSSRNSDSDRSYRSRSMSRTSFDNGKAGYEGDMRKDLDSERESRLRRAMSFTSSRSANGGTRTVKSKHNESKSILGSMKSLYSTLSKKVKKGMHVPGSNSSSTGSYDKHGNPIAPPRKHRSSSYLGSGTSSVANGHRNGSLYSDQQTGRNWNAYSGSGGRGGGGGAGGDPIHQKTNRSSNYGTPRAAVTQHQQQHRVQEQHEHRHEPEVEKKPRKLSQPFWRPRKSQSPERATRGRKVERRKTMAGYDNENREPPRFEGGRRDRSAGGSRFFGQDDVVEPRERVAPDMRRLLIGNMNLSRSRSLRDVDAVGVRPHVRAI